MTARRIRQAALAAAVTCLLGGCDAGSNRPPSAPVITASDTLVESGDRVQLAATSIDPDGDPISWFWHATGGAFNVTTASAVVWTAPAVSGTQSFTVTAEARDAEGLASSSSIAVTVAASGNGVGGEVIIGTNHDSDWPPFQGDPYDYYRLQVLYLASEINHNGRITKVSIMPAPGGTGGYYNGFALYLAEVSREELKSGFKENYEGQEPALVYQSASLGYPDGADTWYDFDLFSSFDYDTTGNLLVEFVWKGGTGGSVPTYGFETSNHRSNGTPYEDAADGEPSRWALYLKLTFGG